MTHVAVPGVENRDVELCNDAGVAGVRGSTSDPSGTCRRIERVEHPGNGSRAQRYRSKLNVSTFSPSIRAIVSLP